MSSSELSDDERPLGSKPTTAANGTARVLSGKDDSDDEMPLSQTTGRTSQTPDSSALPPRHTLKRKKPVYAESSSDDDVPLASQSSAKQTATAAIAMPGALEATTVPATKVKGKKSAKVESDEDDEPLQKRRPSRKRTKKAADVKTEESDEDFDMQQDSPPKKKRASSTRKRKVKTEDSDVDMSEDEKPIAEKPAAKRAPKKAKVEKEEPDTPKPKKKRGKAKEEETEDALKKSKKKKEEEEQEAVFRWWEQNANGDGSKKWTSLEHNGVLFPPPYEILPKNVKMKYDGREVDLPPASEEVAGFFAATLETDHAEDATFRANFFKDFLEVLNKNPPRNNIAITQLDKCDFRPMYEYFEAEKAKRKAMTTAEKKEVKAEKDAMELKFKFCTLDGRKETIGNFRIEPPGLFRGRGEHPRKGALKLRVRPEDVTINIGKGCPIPVPNVPGKWKSVQHDDTVTWLANWTENVNGNHKYVFLAAGSSLKGQSDMSKFEKARELITHVERIRANYTAELKSKVMATRQRATAMYFIDVLALRAGNEKGEDEADTVGCCSLRCEHLTLRGPNADGRNEIVFDFLGKDSIRYYNTVAVDDQVFKNIRIFKKDKEDSDALFDRVNTSLLNKHLTSEMKGLTAKVFRTYNASWTFQRLLDENPLKGATLQEKLNAYNSANRKVAILCNHQRAAPKTHDQSMEKMRNKIRALKYDRMKLRHYMLQEDTKKKFKKDPRVQDDESDMDDDWIEEHEESLRLKEREKVEKKFAKENEKAVAEGNAEMKPSELKAKLADVDADFKRIKKETKAKKGSMKNPKPLEKLEENLDKMTAKITQMKLQALDRDEGKEVALGTSKINYLDPRITAAWCAAHDVPIEKIFSKTLLTKFPWALEVEQDWKF